MIPERDLLILRRVVDLYVREGVPVSSQSVKDSGVPLSTATIRNVMVRLERDGYIVKPHASSGRVPADEGYSVYVDELDEQSSFGGEFVRRFRSEIREKEMDVSSIMIAASRVLGTLSKHFAVVYGSVIQESRVRRVRLVDLEGSRLLIVVHLTPEHERTLVMRLDRRFDSDVIVRAENWINPLVRGKTVLDAKDVLERAVRDNVTDEGIVIRELSIHRDDIFSEPPAMELYFEDRGHLLDQPELSDPKLLQLLLSLLHNKKLLTSILARRLTEQTRITIGSEHDEREMRWFSLITAGYRMGAARGVLGIMGPTRMRYSYIRDLVGTAAHELAAVGEQYF